MEERVLLPEEDIISKIFSESDSDSTIQSLTTNEIPVALRTPAVTGRDDGSWVSRVFLLNSELVEGKSLDEVGFLAYTDNSEHLMLNVLLGSVQVSLYMRSLHTDQSSGIIIQAF